MPAVATVLTCSVCGTATKDPVKRLPSGWKRHQDAVYCADCWKKLYRLTAITLPVADVLEGGTWEHFREVLKNCWSQSTCLANWAANELHKADVTRRPADEKMPKMPTVYLYPEATRQYPELKATALNAVIHAVEKKYKKARLDVVWRRNRALPTHRYPMPYPEHNRAWRARWHETTGEGGHAMRQPAVLVTLMGERFVLRLRGLRYYRAAFEQMTNGSACPGELALYRKLIGESHRRGGTAKIPGGGNKLRYRIMCKLVAYLPREERDTSSRRGLLQLRTAKRCLLVGVMPNRVTAWLYHADYLRRRVHAHNRQLQSLSDDTKAERRPITAGTRTRYRVLCLRHRQYMDSELRRIVSIVMGLLKRSRLRGVVYDDADRRYGDLPYYDLERFLREACDREGYHYEHASGDVVETLVDEAMSANGDGDED